MIASVTATSESLVTGWFGVLRNCCTKHIGNWGSADKNSGYLVVYVQSFLFSILWFQKFGENFHNFGNFF
jgi:hypothetical protein